MNIQVKIFGQLAEIIGSHELQLQGINDTDLLREKLISGYPKLADYPFVVAVDKKVVKENTKLNTNDSVALLPPFAGG